VDPWFIVSQVPDEAKLIHAARLVNDGKPRWVVEKVKNEIESLRNSGLGDKTITLACLGISFKPDLDDLRESPSLKIVEILAGLKGIALNIVEPNIDKLPKQLATRENVMLTDFDSAIVDASFVIALVAHSEFRSENNKKILQNSKVIEFSSFSK
jgi:UDP-N-acetyl-D-mannosaminuronic acid dehydrogenase